MNKKVLFLGMLMSFSMGIMAQSNNGGFGGQGGFPGGGPGGEPGGGPGGFPGGGTTETLPKGATYVLSDGTTKTLSDTTLVNDSADYNVVQVTNGTLTIKNSTLNKTGDTETTGGDATSFYGTNASAFVSSSDGNLVLDGVTINSTADGANGVFAYNGGTATVNDITIVNNSVRSRGLHATYGGKITATNVNITTNKETSSTIATDRGGGFVYVTGGTSTAKGARSAVLYSTGTIEATDLTGLSEQAEIADVEGDNHVIMTNCDMTSGSSERGIMMLQSGSGDATGNNAYVTAVGCKLTTTNASAPLCEVPTANTGTLTLTDCTLSVASGTLLYVDYNKQWQTYGGYGNLVLKTTQDSWTYEGDVKADSYSNASITVGENVTWNGSNDTDNTAKTASVTVEKGGVWVLTGNSNVSTLTNNGTIYLNGFTLNADSQSGSGTIVEGTTGIAGITATDGSSDQKIYNISGQYVGSDMESLPTGIYIVNGKKVLK